MFGYDYTRREASDNVRNARFPNNGKERTMIKKVAVLLAASVLSIPAYAADQGWYLLGEVGTTKFKNIDTTGLTNASVDDTDMGFKLGGGYMLNKFFGVEAAYAD